MTRLSLDRPDENEADIVGPIDTKRFGKQRIRAFPIDRQASDHLIEFNSAAQPVRAEQQNVTRAQLNPDMIELDS